MCYFSGAAIKHLLFVCGIQAVAWAYFILSFCAAKKKVWQRKSSRLGCSTTRLSVTSPEKRNSLRSNSFFPDSLLHLWLNASRIVLMIHLVSLRRRVPGLRSLRAHFEYLISLYKRFFKLFSTRVRESMQLLHKRHKAPSFCFLHSGCRQSIPHTFIPCTRSAQPKGAFWIFDLAL